MLMQKLTLFALAVALVACSDNDKLPSSGNRDAGGESRDAGTGGEGDGGETPAPGSGLERPPGSLPRPPGNKLPDDLKPPGYSK
jgi:hypothetical protein